MERQEGNPDTRSKEEVGFVERFALHCGCAFFLHTRSVKPAQYRWPMHEFSLYLSCKQVHLWWSLPKHLPEPQRTWADRLSYVVPRDEFLRTQLNKGKQVCCFLREGSKTSNKEHRMYTEVRPSFHSIKNMFIPILFPEQLFSETQAKLSLDGYTTP